MIFRRQTCAFDPDFAPEGVSGSLALSVAAHGAVLALVWAALTHPRPSPAAPEMSVMVSLTSAAEAAAIVQAEPRPALSTRSTPRLTPAAVAPSPALARLSTPEGTSPGQTTATATPSAASATAPSMSEAGSGLPSRPEGRGETAEPVSAPRFDAAYLRNPAPAYPPLSRKSREQGTVLLRVLVDEQGQARDVRLQSSSGHDRLDQAALNAVARWQFQPARQGTRTVSAWVVVPLIFALKD